MVARAGANSDSNLHVSAAPVLPRVLSQPDAADAVQIEAWYMDDSKEDQRLPHKCAA